MIEQELNRIANALEKIEGHLAKTVALTAELSIKPTAAAAPVKAAPVAPEKPAAAALEVPQGEGSPVTTKRSRQEIKEKLDHLGIQYNDRLRTENLEKLLEDAEKGTVKAAPAAAVADDPFAPQQENKDVFGTELPAEKKQPEKVYTVNEAIEIAKRLAAKFGADKTVPIINSFGCANVSEIDKKGKLQDFVKKVLEKEKEYERK